MTKRRTSSPYPYPPGEFVRDLMNVGWRRCDSEAIDVVRRCLARAADPDGLRPRAQTAGRALAKEPVLAGAILRLGDDPETGRNALRLLLAAGPGGDTKGLGRLFVALEGDAFREHMLRCALRTLADDFDEVLD